MPKKKKKQEEKEWITSLYGLSVQVKFQLNGVLEKLDILSKAYTWERTLAMTDVNAIWRLSGLREKI